MNRVAWAIGLLRGRSMGLRSRSLLRSWVWVTDVVYYGNGKLVSTLRERKHIDD